MLEASDVEKCDICALSHFFCIFLGKMRNIIDTYLNEKVCTEENTKGEKCGLSKRRGATKCKGRRG